MKTANLTAAPPPVSPPRPNAKTTAAPERSAGEASGGLHDRACSPRSARAGHPQDSLRPCHHWAGLTGTHRGRLAPRCCIVLFHRLLADERVGSAVVGQVKRDRVPTAARGRASRLSDAGGAEAPVSPHGAGAFGARVHHMLQRWQCGSRCAHTAVPNAPMPTARPPWGTRLTWTVKLTVRP